MINYQSPRPIKEFFMMANGIDNELSAYAYYLLVKYMNLKPNEDNSNYSMRIKTKFSKRILDRAKKELVTKGYLDTKQLHGNIYALYIGKESVQKYKQTLKKLNNRYEQNELLKVKKENEDGSRM
jgi:hypothetical protein